MCILFTMQPNKSYSTGGDRKQPNTFTVNSIIITLAFTSIALSSSLTFSFNHRLSSILALASLSFFFSQAFYPFYPFYPPSSYALYCSVLFSCNSIVFLSKTSLFKVLFKTHSIFFSSFFFSLNLFS